MSWTDDELRLAWRMRAAGYTYKEIGLRIRKKEKTVAGYMVEHKMRPIMRRLPEGSQLCWDCRKANGSGDCEWANSACRETVPGWTAREVEPRSQHSVPGTWYLIEACPKFVHD